MNDRMRGSAGRVETTRWGAAPARVRDLVGYGALIVAPHPDDEVLGCGGLIASASRPETLEVLVLTDGSGSPPAAAGDPGLPEVRRAETRRALEELGLEPGRISFLDLPDGALAAEEARLDRELRDAVTRAAATDVFVPFRFDRHADHQAAHAAGRRLLRSAGIRLWEYFVYPFWRLLPGGDVRGFLRPDAMYALPLTPVAARAKRQALEAYRSQTTLYAPGQVRPVLGPDFLDAMSEGPETFLRYEVARPGRSVLRRGRWWFRAVYRIEPPLKRAKDAVIEKLGARP